MEGFRSVSRSSTKQLGEDTTLTGELHIFDTLAINRRVTIKGKADSITTIDGWRTVQDTAGGTVIVSDGAGRSYTGIPEDVQDEQIDGTPGATFTLRLLITT